MRHINSFDNKKDIVTGTINVPSGLSGQTRMRVTMRNGSSPAPCDIFSYGEVEDYTVDFGNIPTGSSKIIDFDLTLYPNPAKNTINVLLSDNQNKVNIKLYNALGVVILEFETSDVQYTIDLNGYPIGLYYIGADNGISTTLKKFLKN